MLLWEGFALGLICPRICGHFLAHYYIWLCFCDSLSQVENKSNEQLQTVVTADWCPNGLTGHRPVAVRRLSTIFSVDALSNTSVHYRLSTFVYPETLGRNSVSSTMSQQKTTWENVS